MFECYLCFGGSICRFKGISSSRQPFLIKWLLKFQNGQQLLYVQPVNFYVCFHDLQYKNSATSNQPGVPSEYSRWLKICLGEWIRTRKIVLYCLYLNFQLTECIYCVISFTSLATTIEMATCNLLEHIMF